ncbi:MAG: hypothetical protein ABSH49_17310 [Bryobacteraceae bacterium]|jgi:hypothetical protein
MYKPAAGPVRPFYEDEEQYGFRFFCGDSPAPHENWIPKSGPNFSICTGCRGKFTVHRSGNGIPELHFGGSTATHSAAEEVN